MRKTILLTILTLLGMAANAQERQLGLFGIY